MKKKISFWVLVMLFITSSTCEESLTSEEEGEKASAEFCECLRENSLSHCEDKLNSKYSSYTTDSEFIKAFNDANNCNITISKKK